MADIDVEKIESMITDAVDGLGTVVKSTKDYLYTKKVQAPKLYESFKKVKGGSTAQTIFGMALAGGAIAVLFASGPFLACGLLAVAGYSVLSGFVKSGRAKRFQSYVSYLGKKTVLSIEELAKYSGKKADFILKDLKDMKTRRYFLQGHFSEDEREFITSDETYQQYRLLMDSKKKERRAEEEKQQSYKKAGFSAETIRVLEEGEDYIQKIHEANEKLPGEVVSTKLDRLEQVISRILEELKEQPGKTFELRRLMNYYLPTTWKLLSAYLQIEEEPYKTEAMLKTQADVEKTLDTINEAFEELLSQLFQNRAMDVSADISVLNTMMKQDHLKKDFE